MSGEHVKAEGLSVLWAVLGSLGEERSLKRKDCRTSYLCLANYFTLWGSLSNIIIIIIMVQAKVFNSGVIDYSNDLLKNLMSQSAIRLAFIIISRVTPRIT